MLGNDCDRVLCGRDLSIHLVILQSDLSLGRLVAGSGGTHRVRENGVTCLFVLVEFILVVCAFE
jgi:hypothetical protein